MQVIPAVFEDGVFKPKGPVDLPDASEVELRIEVRAAPPRDHLKAIYGVLSRRHDTGEADLAARHEEYESAVIGSLS